MRKGQLEFVALLAVGIVVAVVVLYTYASQRAGSGGNIVSGAPGEVQASANSLIRSIAVEELRTLAEQGGVDQPEGPAFLGKAVSAWGSGQPDIAANLGRAVQERLNANRGVLAQSFKNDQVTVGEAQVSARLLPDKVELTVNMPTKVRGTAIPQPYKLTIPSKLGSIVRFANRFLAEQGKYRYLENFIVLNAFFQYENSLPSLPVVLPQLSCGEFYYQDWFSLKPVMERNIRQALGHTYLAGTYPTNVGDKTSAAKWSLATLPGSEWRDIDVTFHLPDDFSLTQSSFQFTPNPVMASPQVIPLIGSCYSDPVLVKYYVSFPVIVRATDRLSGSVFQFSVPVLIRDSKPGDLQAAGYQSELQTEICSSLFCRGSVRVTGTDGRPLQSASVSFMGCGVGQTDAAGVFSGDIPCGFGSLDIHKAGFAVVSQGQAFSDLQDLPVRVPSLPKTKINFYDAIIQNDSIGKQWILSSGSINPLNVVHKQQVVRLDFYPLTGSGTVITRLFTEQQGTLELVPEGRYAVTATLMDDDFSRINGAFGARFDLTSEMAGRDLYVAVPFFAGMSSMDNESFTSHALQFGRVLRQCGAGPIGLSPVNVKTQCSVPHTAVLNQTA